MATIRVFNLTDVETLVLKQHHLCNMTFAVGNLILHPGGSGEVADDAMNRAHLLHFVTVGAAAVGSLPSGYVLAKERLPKPKPVVEVPVEAPVEVVLDVVLPPVSKKKNKE